MSAAATAAGKRPAADVDADGNGVAAPPEAAPGSAAPPGKMPRLADDNRVARLPVGANLVEFDGKACTHEVAWPPGMEGSPLPPPKREGPPAREYPFKIDPFQQVAVNCLEAGELGTRRMAAWSFEGAVAGEQWHTSTVQPPHLWAGHTRQYAHVYG